MKYFVTGGAGFIGSNMTDRLLARGDEVVVYDNFSTGRREFLEQALTSSRFTLVEGDTLDQERLTHAMRGCDFVFHFAANADVRMGCEHPARDLEQNTVATFHVLEAMRNNRICSIGFSSTGSVYGEAQVIRRLKTPRFRCRRRCTALQSWHARDCLRHMRKGLDLRFIFSGLYRFWENATRTGMCMTFTKSSGKTLGSCIFSGTGNRKSPICMCRTAWMRSLRSPDRQGSG